MRISEIEAIFDAIGHLFSRYLAFFVAWLFWMIVTFFTVGPITDIWLVADGTWIWWTLGAMMLPGVLALPNAAVVYFRDRHSRKQLRLDRLRKRTRQLERELGL